MSDRDTVKREYDKKINEIDNSQTEYYSTRFKYEQIKKGELQDWLEVHEYVGPQGEGYIKILHAIEGKDEFIKTIHVGPEKRISRDWYKVTYDERIDGIRR